jgi:hypothetical protein
MLSTRNNRIAEAYQTMQHTSVAHGQTPPLDQTQLDCLSFNPQQCRHWMSGGC